MMREFCQDAAGYMAGGEGRTIAVHCKAGRGRTGLMVCAYLLSAVRLGLGEGQAWVRSRLRLRNQSGWGPCPAGRSCMHKLALIGALSPPWQSAQTLSIIMLQNGHRYCVLPVVSTKQEHSRTMWGIHCLLLGCALAQLLHVMFDNS